MQPHEARKILSALEVCTDQRLFDLGKYINVEQGDVSATLDGQFTADQLEAIALWMRDAQSIIGA